MKILILDDIQHRLNVFQKMHDGDEVVCCTHYLEFLEALSTQKWDLIRLDHDLGDFRDADTYVDGWGKIQEYNGCHAAMRICELPDDKKPERVIVHSVNPTGSADMTRTLLKAGIETTREPFAEPEWNQDE